MLCPFAPLLFRKIVVAACVATAALASVVACGDASSEETLTPITKVTVRSESLTSSLGCGTTGDVMYKYAALVIDEDLVVVAAGVYDCFADATAFNLAPAASDAKALDFTIKIFAFNKAAYDAQAAGADPFQIDKNFQNVDFVKALKPTWSVLCSATQQRSVEVLAVCGSAAVGSRAFGGSDVDGPASFVVPLDTLVGADGSPAVCNERFAKATVVAHVRPTSAQRAGEADFFGAVDCPFTPSIGGAGGGGTGASDGGSLDASTDGGAADADAGPRTGPVAAPYTAFGAIAPATYTVEVTLSDTMGATTAVTTCTVGTSPGLTTHADCAPLRAASR